jgi:2'-5' RNA ligase
MKTAIVGVPIPAEVRAALEKALGGLHTGAFVAGENMHVSVADIGEQPDWMIDKLATALGQVEVGPFYVKIDGLGTVGGASPTEIYAEIEDASLLKKLHRQVTRVARVEGVDIPHQKWTPGVTLARFGELAQHDMKQILSFLSRRAGLTAGPFPATEFVLWEVKAEGGKTVHDPIQTYRLRM